MPRFYIDTTDGDLLVRDDVGHDYSDLHAAKQAAVAALPDIAREELPDGDDRIFTAIVRDEAGVARVQASLKLTVAAVAGS